MNINTLLTVPTIIPDCAGARYGGGYNRECYTSAICTHSGNISGGDLIHRATQPQLRGL
jgi:hypothetical protein